MANKGEAYSADNAAYKQDPSYPQGNTQPQGYPPQQGGYPPQQAGYPMYQYHQGSNVVVTQPVATTVITNRPNDYFAFSLLTCLFCFWPTGIAALVFSCSSRDASDRMDYTAAESNGRMAKIFSIISLVIGLIWIVAVVIYLIVLFTVLANYSRNTYSYYG